MSWNYAELTKAAKLAGGPEVFVQSLINAGRAQMGPVIVGAGLAGAGVGLAGGACLTLGIMYVCKKVEEKCINKAVSETAGLEAKHIQACMEMQKKED